MLVIKIELHSAVTHRVTTLGEAIIANEGARLPGDKHNYNFRIARKGTDYRTLASGAKPTRTGRVTNWPRARMTVWQLLQACLNNAYVSKTDKAQLACLEAIDKRNNGDTCK